MSVSHLCHKRFSFAKKTRKCQIFGKVALIKRGQIRHTPWNLLYFQPQIFCKIYRSKVFSLSDMLVGGLSKWTSSKCSNLKFYLFFHECFSNFYTFFYSTEGNRDTCANTAEKCYDFFMINYFQLRNFKSKGQSSFLFIRLHMEVMHSVLKMRGCHRCTCTTKILASNAIIFNNVQVAWLKSDFFKR